MKLNIKGRDAVMAMTDLGERRGLGRLTLLSGAGGDPSVAA